MIDALACDRKTTVFRLADVAFVFQIPNRKQEVFPRGDHHVFQLEQR